MTAVLVALVVMGALLAALVLVLRFLEKREARVAVGVAASVEERLLKAIKTAEDRISRLEMQKMVR